MNYKNKLKITEVKYWMLNDGKPVKASIADLCEVKVMSVRKCIASVNRKIESGEEYLEELNNPNVSIFQQMTNSFSIKSTQRSVDSMKVCLEKFNKHNPNELYVVDESDEDIVKHIPYKQFESKHVEEKLSECGIRKYTEISREQYLIEKQNFGDCVGRWNSRSKKEESEDFGFGLIDLLFVNMIFWIVLHHILK